MFLPVSQTNVAIMLSKVVDPPSRNSPSFWSRLATAGSECCRPPSPQSCPSRRHSSWCGAAGNTLGTCHFRPESTSPTLPSMTPGRTGAKGAAARKRQGGGDKRGFSKGTVRKREWYCCQVQQDKAGTDNFMKYRPTKNRPPPPLRGSLTPPPLRDEGAAEREDTPGLLYTFVKMGSDTGSRSAKLLTRVAIAKFSSKSKSSKIKNADITELRDSCWAWPHVSSWLKPNFNQPSSCSRETAG